MSTPAFAACPLCQRQSPQVLAGFHACPQCSGVFRAPEGLPTPEVEKRRYETHNNDVLDPRYQAFVAPIMQAVLKDFSPHHRGLDFGAGTGPVISYLLEQQGYAIKQYDPFFHPHPHLLTQTYDYIVCCEVIEHFHHPAREFERFKKLLNPGGSLFCMTLLYEKEIDFGNWHYKNDETHVFFYSSETLAWIKDRFGFSGLEIENRLIRLDS
jgi:SAM-dependent methyltransferase